MLDIKTDFVQDLKLPDGYTNMQLEMLEEGDSRYMKDSRVNLKNVLSSEFLTAKETALIGLAISANQKNERLIVFFKEKAELEEASAGEIAEAVACASLLATNNVFYRFRHFIKKEAYNKMPGRIRMNIMARPVLGREFFELLSLAISAVNGCEMCVTSHEASLKQLGSSDERIFDTIRLASVLVGLDKII